MGFKIVWALTVLAACSTVVEAWLCNGITGPDELSETNRSSFYRYARCYSHLTPGHGEIKQALTNIEYRWPNGRMPYVLDDSVSATDLETIQGGINLIQEKTCLRIFPRTNEENYILIKTNDKDGGCFSQVGMRGGVQVLNLERDGCTIASTAAHELLHAAGLNHEHARADRDEYIFVDYQNVCNATENQDNYDRCNDTGYASEDCSSYGYKYNVKSIMHYMGLVTDRNFAVDPTKPIMTSRDPNNPIPNSDNDQLTEEDAGKINTIYNNCNGNPK